MYYIYVCKNKRKHIFNEYGYIGLCVVLNGLAFDKPQSLYNIFDNTFALATTRLRKKKRIKETDYFKFKDSFSHSINVLQTAPLSPVDNSVKDGSLKRYSKDKTDETITSSKADYVFVGDENGYFPQELCRYTSSKRRLDTLDILIIIGYVLPIHVVRFVVWLSMLILRLLSTIWVWLILLDCVLFLMCTSGHLLQISLQKKAVPCDSDTADTYPLVEEKTAWTWEDLFRENTVPENINYSSYKIGNKKISVPDFLTRKEQNRKDSLVFRDGQVELLVADHATDQSLDEFHEYVINEIGEGAPVYDLVRSNYFIMSGYDKLGNIYYTKVYMDTMSTPQVLYRALIHYPVTEKDRINEIIPRIFNRFPNKN